MNFELTLLGGATSNLEFPNLQHKETAKQNVTTKKKTHHTKPPAKHRHPCHCRHPVAHPWNFLVPARSAAQPAWPSGGSCNENSLGWVVKARHH
jgi:hypothetical protein